MIRRRRRKREIPFSLDSFLDVVANVVGIIIRLILVAWVGARTYTSLTPAAKGPQPAPPSISPSLHDPLEDELARRRRELEEAKRRLLAQLGQLPPVQEKQRQASQQLALLSTQHEELVGQHTTLGQVLAEQKQAASGLAPSLAELQERQRKLREEVLALEKLPPLKKVHYYRTPISQPVHTEELHFECKADRVSFIDITAFIAEIRAGLKDKAEELRQQWQVTGVTQPVGAFQLRYVVERMREGVESLAPAGTPDGTANFGYGLSGWQVEPILPQRGEAADAALAPGSEFRHIVEGVDAKCTVITFWIYPDSFALYRRLRDFLYERQIEVAGRPLPNGATIAASRHGTKSRGQ